MLVESKEQGLIAEAEYMQRLQNQREKMQAEIDKKLPSNVPIGLQKNFGRWNKPMIGRGF